MKQLIIKVFLGVWALQFLTVATAQELENDIYHEKLFEFLEEINRGEVNNFLAAFDSEKFTDRVFEDLPANDQDVRMFRIGFEEGLEKSFIPSVRTMFQYYDAINYVSYSEVGGFYSILLRGTGDQSGLNYIELVVDSSEKNDLKFIDIYSYFSGEFMSSIMNRNAKLFIAENSTFSNILSSFSIKEKEFTESLPKLIKMEKYRNMGDLEEIIKVYDTVPKSAQKEKVFLLTAITAAQSTDETRYLELIKTYKDQYPEDPSLPLITLDYHLLRGEIETSKKLVNDLDEIVGGDNYLNIIRSNICFIDEEKRCAISYLEEAINKDIYLEEAYWGLLELNLLWNNFEDVNKQLTALEEIFGYEFSSESMAEVELYTEYLKSDFFKEWNTKK
jgi:tetratricopeptide (TPR) repeat protein